MRLHGVYTKDGVQFTRIALAGFRVLGAIERAARELAVDLTITSACDGQHSGPNDPHHLGEAYDIRTKNLTPDQKIAVVRAIMLDLADGEAPLSLGSATGLATRKFFGFIEARGTANEHIHVQRRKGEIYP